MAERADITPELLRQIYSYDPETGAIINRKFSRAAFTGTDPLGYHRTNVKGVRLTAHRAAWAIHHGAFPCGEIDHINGDRGDNRLINLRVVSRSENCRNLRLPKHNTTGVVGLYRDKRNGKWHSSIKFRGKTHYLGSYLDFDQAVEARRAAERKFGFHPNHGSKPVNVYQRRS